MTRRNDKRNQRRNHKEDNSSTIAASMIFGAIMNKIFDKVHDEKEKKTKVKDLADEPFDGIRKVSDNCIESGIHIPADGTAKEIPVPEGLQIFISEDGKPMIRKKVEDDGEQKNKFAQIAYHQLAKDLYKGAYPYYWNVNTDNEYEAIDTYECSADYDCLFNCYTEAQVRRLMAFNKLQNIATYLNDGWKPDFKDDSDKYFIYLDGVNKKYHVARNVHCMDSGVHFKTEKLAERAIEIMGEASLADLFNTNW